MTGIGTDLAQAAAVCAALLQRLTGAGAAAVRMPDGVVTLDVDVDTTLTQLLNQIRGARQSFPRPPDVTVGSAVGSQAEVGRVPVRFHNPAGAGSHLSERLETLRSALVAEPSRPLTEISPVGPAERETLLSFNPLPVPAPRTPVHETICAQAEKTPGAIAMRADGVAWTYEELLDEAALVAGRLRADGAGPGCVVGICTRRNAQMIVAILGILLTGAAYLPLDPTHPLNRLGLMLTTAGASILLVGPGADLPLAGYQIPLRTLAGERMPADADTAAGPPRAWPVAWRHYSAPPEVADGLSYVIFTSGSTGQPKGVQMTHASLANRLAWMREEYRLGPSEVVLQKTPYTFDVSVWEILWPLTAGACLAVAPPDIHRDPRELASLIVSEQATVIHFVPSMLSIFEAEDCAAQCTSLRLVICSGEILPPKLVNKLTALLPDVAVHNLYGPTEAAIDVTAWPCRRPEPDNDVPIGRPIANVTAYVLNETGGLAPLGACGELVLGGSCLAAGYAGRPDLTAERFVVTTVAGSPERVYRTGDLVRWSPEGHLSYVGRIDTQVKIRGQRVELSEIEAVLNRHPAVASSAVILRDDLGSAPALVAYVVAEPGASPDDKALRCHLGDHLPDYMIPLRYVTLAALPTTANGKANRQALPAPPARVTRRGPRHPSFADVDPPRTETAR
jgi:amino acid adenylation domain-containing protein